MVSLDVNEYRPSFGRGLAIAVLGIAALGFIISLVSNPLASLRYLPILALVVTLVWAAFWWPAVIVTPAGVTIKNILRTIELPWPAIQAIDTRYALTLQTAYGQYSAWAAPAPGRAGVAQAAKTGGNSIGERVSRRYDEVRASGLLNGAKLERDRPIVRWHWPLIAAMAILLLATILTFTVL